MPSPHEHAGKYKECCACELQTVCLKYPEAQQFQCRSCERILVSYFPKGRETREFVTLQSMTILPPCPFAEEDLCGCYISKSDSSVPVNDLYLITQIDTSKKG